METGGTSETESRGEHKQSNLPGRRPTLLDGQHGLGGVQRPAEAGPAGWGVLWGHCGPSAAFARSPSNLTEQVWEADGDIYWLSWLITVDRGH